MLERQGRTSATQTRRRTGSRRARVALDLPFALALSDGGRSPGARRHGRAVTTAGATQKETCCRGVVCHRAQAQVAVAAEAHRGVHLRTRGGMARHSPKVGTTLPCQRRAISYRRARTRGGGQPATSLRAVGRSGGEQRACARRLAGADRRTRRRLDRGLVGVQRRIGRARCRRLSVACRLGDRA